MKTVFLGTTIALVLLSIIAWRIQPAQVVDHKVQLTWVSDDNPVRRAQVDLFNRISSDCRVSLDPNNQGLDKIIVQSIAGVGPDMFDCCDPGSLDLLVKSGVTMDITDELNKEKIRFNGNVWNVNTGTAVANNRIYGFPTNSGSSAMWFNKDMFDRAGVPYPKGPWKWTDLVPVAQRLTIRDKNGRAVQYGLLFDWWMWPQFVMQFGGSMYSKDQTRCTLDSPQAIAAVQFMHDLIYKYRVSPSPIEEQSATQGGWGSGTISMFGSGRSAMAVGARYWLCSLRSYKGLRYGAVECPHADQRVFLGVSRSVLLNKNSHHLKQAFEFLRFLAGKDYNDLVNHQADGIGPVIRFEYTKEYMNDPDYPAEDFNAMWRDSMKYTVAYPPPSPFIKGQACGRILNKQMDLIKADQKSVAEGMKTATKAINAEIQRNIEGDPSLRREYDRVTGKQR